MSRKREWTQSIDASSALSDRRKRSVWDGECNSTRPSRFFSLRIQCGCANWKMIGANALDNDRIRAFSDRFQQSRMRHDKARWWDRSQLEIELTLALSSWRFSNSALLRSTRQVGDRTSCWLHHASWNVLHSDHRSILNSDCTDAIDWEYQSGPLPMVENR